MVKGRFVAKVAKKLKTKKKSKQSYARLDPFTRGVIWGMHIGEVPRQEMLKHVRKTDGSKLQIANLDQVIAHRKANPNWNGESSNGGAGGRPLELSEKECQDIVDLVFRERGRAKVTVNFCKKTFPKIRRVSNQTVERVLHRAGFKYLTRRLKWFVPAEHKKARVLYAQMVLRKHDSTLLRFAYTDGTTFYLARTVDEKEHKQRAALGRSVWRMSSGKDGLFEDNIGPSLYSKSQGLPVKIWGFLANGKLLYWTLPVDRDPEQNTTHMNQGRYQDLVASHFVSWRRECFGDNEACHLVQDHEKCLRTQASLACLAKAGCPVVADYPNCSPDLNAIENVWKLLRARLQETEPVAMESRAEFLARLRRTVAWLNNNQRDQLLTFCRNQKERARAVLAAKPPGSKTKW